MHAVLQGQILYRASHRFTHSSHGSPIPPYILACRPIPPLRSRQSILESLLLFDRNDMKSLALRQACPEPVEEIRANG